MSIRVDLSQSDGVGFGVRVFNEDGGEIDDVMEMDIRIAPNELITAKMEVMVHPDSDLSGLLAVLGFKSLKELAASQGYNLTQRQE